MIGVVIAAVGWVCMAVGLVLMFGPIALVGVGVATLPAGLLVDWEKAVIRGKRP